MTFASGSAIADILKQMKVAAGAARSEDLTADQRLALQSDYDALRSQIGRIASSAQFNGVNLAAAGGRDINVIIADPMSFDPVQKIRTANSTPVFGPPQRVSTNSAGDQAVGGESRNAFVSNDGRFVVFRSWATNLVAGDTNGYQDTFLKDLQTGVVTRISTDSLGQQAIGGGGNSGRFSPDGSFVLLTSDATNLVPGDTNGQTDLFLKDLQTGEMTRIATDASGNQAVGGLTTAPRLSEDGRYVTFTSGATNLVPGDTNGLDDVFVKDLQTGAISRISTDVFGAQSTGGASYASYFSSDGRYVAFESAATNLVANDTNGLTDSFVKDLQTGAITRVSTDASGQQANGGSYIPMFSPDGRFVGFESDATNLVSGDTNGRTDVF